MSVGSRLAAINPSSGSNSRKRSSPSSDLSVVATMEERLVCLERVSAAVELLSTWMLKPSLSLTLSLGTLEGG